MLSPLSVTSSSSTFIIIKGVICARYSYCIKYFANRHRHLSGVNRARLRRKGFGFGRIIYRGTNCKQFSILL